MPSTWKRKFFEPIMLLDGRKLVTLQDAGEYVSKLPASVQQTWPWQTATQCLLLELKADGHDPMLARIAMMQALYPAGERVFNPDRKEPHWGKRKLKRDK